MRSHERGGPCGGVTACEPQLRAAKMSAHAHRAPRLYIRTAFGLLSAYMCGLKFTFGLHSDDCSWTIVGVDSDCIRTTFGLERCFRTDYVRTAFRRPAHWDHIGDHTRTTLRLLCYTARPCPPQARRGRHPRADGRRERHPRAAGDGGRARRTVGEPAPQDARAAADRRARGLRSRRAQMVRRGVGAGVQRIRVRHGGPLGALQRVDPHGPQRVRRVRTLAPRTRARTPTRLHVHALSVRASASARVPPRPLLISLPHSGRRRMSTSLARTASGSCPPLPPAPGSPPLHRRRQPYQATRTWHTGLSSCSNNGKRGRWASSANGAGYRGTCPRST